MVAGDISDQRATRPAYQNATTSASSKNDQKSAKGKKVEREVGKFVETESSLHIYGEYIIFSTLTEPASASARADMYFASAIMH